jgi:hypothetical protein
MSKTTTRTLSGVGDPNAPVGSREWLEYVVNYAKSTARDVSAKCGDLQKILQTIRECDAHKAAGFASFELFLARRIGISADQAKAVLEAKPSVKVAAVLRKVGRPKATGGNDGISIVSPVGSGPAYWAARLRRDYPDAAFDESVRGSVRQAAIAAGIVKVPGVLEQLCKLWAKASDADRRTFIDEVTNGTHP